MTGLRDQILAADDIERERAEVPEWDTHVWVRGLTAGEVEDFGRRFNTDKLENVMAGVLVKLIEDDDQRRVFEDEDVEALEAKSPQVIKRLFDIASRISGLDDIAGDEATKD